MTGQERDPPSAPAPVDLTRLVGARVLVTRAAPGAIASARRLAVLGAKPIIAPVLHARPRPLAADAAAGVQAVLVTSANAARRLSDLDMPVDTPVFAVGAATARAAREARRSNVSSAEGDGRALAAFVQRALDPAKGPVLHLHGVHTAGDLLGDLRAAGFQTREATAYEAAALDDLPEAAREALAGRTADAILFHSARGAQTAARLIERARVSADCARLCAVAMSRAALAPAESLPFMVRRVAQHPSEASLFEALAFALTART